MSDSCCCGGGLAEAVKLMQSGKPHSGLQNRLPMLSDHVSERMDARKAAETGGSKVVVRVFLAIIINVI